MLAAERRNLILEKLQEERRVVVSELSDLFGVSEETIRRDLDKLAWKRHTFYQSLIDQGFNSEQAMQILLNEF